MKTSALILLFVVMCVTYASSVDLEHSSLLREKRQIKPPIHNEFKNAVKDLLDAMKKAGETAPVVLKTLGEFDKVLKVLKEKTDAVLDDVK